MNLTKQQRFVFYCILLVEAKENIKYLSEGGHLCRGLCSLIYMQLDLDVDSCELEDNEDDCSHMSKVFPELWKQKPETVHVYWFPVSVKGWKQRIKLLKKCIELTA